MSAPDIIAAKHVFIDTSVFESENFVEGSKINKLFDLSCQGHIQILISRITFREVISCMTKRLLEAKKYMENNRKEMDKNLRILRNIEAYKIKFPMSEIKKSEDIEFLVNRFEDLLRRGNALVFETPVDYRLVFEKYFGNEPPFNTENKKHEFPDAFALAMLENYCREMDIKSYALSQDKDMIAYNSPYLIAEKDLGKLIDKINRHIQEKTRLENIAKTDAVIKIANNQFLQELESSIENALRESASEINTPFLDVESVNFIEVKNLAITDYSILSVNNRDAQVDFEISFDFSVEYEGIDYSEAVYDREDNRWFGEKQIDDTMEGSMTISTEGVVFHTHADGSIGNEIMIVAINNDHGLDLREYY